MTPPRQPSDTSDKVTLAVLGEKIDNLNKTVGDYIDSTNSRIRCNEIEIGKIQQVQAGQVEKIDHIGNSVKSWNLLNSVGAAIAVVLGGLGISK